VPGVSPGAANLHGRVPMQEAWEHPPFAFGERRCGGAGTLRRDAIASPRLPYTYTYREVLQVPGSAVILG
jgi:hypothetical protein